MIGWIAPTDHDWFTFLAAQPALEEVNFWTPSTHFSFRSEPGTPFFFKLKSPHNAIAGFGYFARYDPLPEFLAWECFGVGNGAPSFQAMKARLEGIRARILVSDVLKEHFQNGKSYYPYQDRPLAVIPDRPENRPNPELLRWHNGVCFKRRA